jgi:predicted Holliday junction resolvase-like endonuclease
MKAMFENLETEIRKYPRERVWYLERQVQFEIEQKNAVILEKEKIDQSFSRLSADYKEMFQIKKDFEVLSGKVTNELAPATMREARMKKRIMELYM